MAWFAIRRKDGGCWDIDNIRYDKIANPDMHIILGPFEKDLEAMIEMRTFEPDAKMCGYPGNE
jgi:hypothetical protein